MIVYLQNLKKFMNKATRASKWVYQGNGTQDQYTKINISLFATNNWELQLKNNHYNTVPKKSRQC